MNLQKEKWTKDDYLSFINFLKSQQDLNYLEFHSKLVDTKDNIIGIRTPILKKIAKEISRGNYLEFILLNQKSIYECILIEGFILGDIGYQKNSFSLLSNFISKIDNWATCDLTVSHLKWAKKKKEEVFSFIKEHLESQNPWMKRFCLILLLNYYIEEDYLNFIFYSCDNYQIDHYYVKMAIAWLISICFVKYKEKTLEYLKRATISKWTYNKAIQKIRESTRVSKKDKDIVWKMKK